jgi:hypothetical protein
VRLPAVATLLHKNIQAKDICNCRYWLGVLLSTSGNHLIATYPTIRISIEIVLKEKREKKKHNKRRRGWLQRSNAINAGFVCWLCVYGGISLQTKVRAVVAA